MKPTTLRTVFAGAIAMLAVGGGIAFALIAQNQGHSPEPPAWLSLLIGGAATFFYAQAANLNGSAAAVEHFAAAVTARRATDPVAAGAQLAGVVTPTISNAPIGGPAGGATQQGGS